MRWLVLTSALVVLASGCTAVVDAGSYEVGVCDPLENDGCGAGEKCFALISTNERSCMPDGTRGPGMVCTTEADCAAGTTCILLGEDRGLCMLYCRDDEGCAEQEDHAGCAVDDDSGFGFCLQQCDPADPTSCGADVACHANGTFTGCRATGNRGYLDSCGFTLAEACVQGLQCFQNTSGAHVCVPQCGPGLAACEGERVCAVETATAGTYQRAEAGEWGVCVLF